MKKGILITAMITSVLSAYYLSSPNDSPPQIDNSAVHWYTLEEALAAHEDEPKKIFIDMYTDWCGWCKVMDKKTFTDASVIHQLNENYYPVKFDAEGTAPVAFKGRTYNFIASGRKGIHELAYNLLDRSPSYPSFVVLDENLNRENIIKGYQTVERFLPMIK